MAALPPGRPTPAGSAITVLSARSAGPGGLLEDNGAFQVFRLREELQRDANGRTATRIRVAAA